MAMTILVAGATGNLGGRIVDALRKRGATVRALVRPGSDPSKLDTLTGQGAVIVQADLIDPAQLAKACTEVDCVVSALQGLRDVIVDTQILLLEAALTVGVPRFIPSDFASDFTKLPEGENRNFDLRKEFKQHIDGTPIQATSVLNGGFAELLLRDMPLLDFSKKQVSYWGDKDWKVDFTSMDDTAAFTAEAALDPNTPRTLRIASFQISPAELAAAAEQVTGQSFTLVNMGSLDTLAAYNKRERAANPAGEQELYPRWQQSQYMQSMFSVQNDPLDNSRYPDLHWTSVQDLLAQRRG